LNTATIYRGRGDCRHRRVGLKDGLVCFFMVVLVSLSLSLSLFLILFLSLFPRVSLQVGVIFSFLIALV